MLLQLLTALLLIQHGQVVEHYQDFCSRSAIGNQYANCMQDTPTLREPHEGDYVIDMTFFVGKATDLRMVYGYDHVPYLLGGYGDSQ